ncbi:MAG: carbohydrate kinase family protein [Candidatus Aenigmarchaeota archaeon]|nr:carbohydrate kinase family protein [Candidatus Aenigmarchaeota archaeon]
MANEKYEVVGYGALNLDKIFETKGPVNPDGETSARFLEEVPGGSAANTIAGLSRLGVKTAFIGAVGTDDNGKYLFEDIINEGVTQLIKKKDGISGTCDIYTLKGSTDRSIVLKPEVNDEISIDDIPDSTIDAIKNAKYFFSATFACSFEYDSLETQLELTKIAQENNTKTILSSGALYSNPETLRKEKGDILEELLGRTDILFLNEDELKMLTAIESYAEASNDLIEKYGIETIAVTRGKNGCYIKTKDEEIEIKPHYVETIKDSIGAGDSFASGVLYGLINGKTLEICGEIGNYIASNVIQHTGAREGLPTGEDPSIQKLLTQTIA